MTSPAETTPPQRMVQLRKTPMSPRTTQWTTTSSVNSASMITKDDTMSTTSISTDATSVSPENNGNAWVSPQAHKDMVKSRLAKAMGKKQLPQKPKSPQQQKPKPPPPQHKSPQPQQQLKSPQQQQQKSPQSPAAAKPTAAKESPRETLTQRRRRVMGQVKTSSPGASWRTGVAKSQSPKKEESESPVSPTSLWKNTLKKSAPATPSSSPSTKTRSPSPFFASPKTSQETTPTSKPPMAPLAKKTPPKSSTPQHKEEERATRDVARAKEHKPDAPATRGNERKPQVSTTSREKERTPDDSTTRTKEPAATTRVIANGRAEIETPKSASVASLRASFANNATVPVIPVPAPARNLASERPPKITTEDSDEEEKKSSWSENDHLNPQDHTSTIASWKQNNNTQPRSPNANPQENAAASSPESDPKSDESSEPSTFPSWMTAKKFPSGVHDGKPSPSSVASAPSDEGSLTRFPFWMTQQRFPSPEEKLSDATSSQPGRLTPGSFPAWMTQQRFPSVHNGKASFRSPEKQAVKEDKNDDAPPPAESPKDKEQRYPSVPSAKPTWSPRGKERQVERPDPTREPLSPKNRKTWPPKNLSQDSLPNPKVVEEKKEIVAPEIQKKEMDAVTPKPKKVPKFLKTWSSRAQRGSPTPRAEDFVVEDVASTPESVPKEPEGRKSGGDKKRRKERKPPTDTVEIAVMRDSPQQIDACKTERQWASSPVPIQRDDDEKQHEQQQPHDEETASETPSKSLTQMAMDSVFAIDYQKLIAMELHQNPSLSYEDDDTISTSPSKELPLTPSELPKDLQNSISKTPNQDEHKTPDRNNLSASPASPEMDEVELNRSPTSTYPDPVPRLTPSRRDKSSQREHTKSRGASTSSPDNVSDKYQPSDRLTGQAAMASLSTPPLTRESLELSSTKMEEIRGAQVNLSTEVAYGSDVGSSDVYGDPTTYGTATDDVPVGSPTVADRARAVEDWNGGRGMPSPPGFFPSTEGFDAPPPLDIPYHLYSPPDDSPSKIRESWSPPEGELPPSQLHGQWSPEEETSPSKIRASWSPPEYDAPISVADRTKAFEEMPHRKKTPEKSILREPSPHGVSANRNRVRFSEPTEPRLTDDYNSYNAPHEPVTDRYAERLDNNYQPDYNTNGYAGAQGQNGWAPKMDTNDVRHAHEWMNGDAGLDTEMKDEEKDEWMHRDPDLDMVRPDSPMSDTPEVDRYRAMGASPPSPEARHSDSNKGQKQSLDDSFAEKNDAYEMIRLATPPASSGKKAFDPFFSEEDALQENFNFDGDNSFFSNEENSFFSGNDDVDAFNIDPNEDLFPSSSKKKKKHCRIGGKLPPPPQTKARASARDGTPKKSRRRGTTRNGYQIYEEPTAQFSPNDKRFGEEPGELLEI